MSTAEGELPLQWETSFAHHVGQLRCDVVQHPFTVCSRCTRLHLNCKIENNFRRIGKRSRNAEMEREIAELKKQVAQQNTVLPNGLTKSTYDPWNGSQEAVAGLMDLRSGGVENPNGFPKSLPPSPAFRRLEDVTLEADRVTDLFNIFFTFYHPFCPFLNPDKSPDEYLQRSSLLFWTIISIAARHDKTEPRLYAALGGPVMRLTWSTIAEVPQSYHVVKALILLCGWPFPTSSTSTDPTFMLCGVMMQIALQIGLHRPSHAQDFSKFRIELREAELQDRIRTWAVCNTTAQRVATAYGQPAHTLYDFTLDPKSVDTSPNYALPIVISDRLEIEKFVSKVSRTLYTNHHDPVGLGSDHERTTYIAFLKEDYERLRTRVRADSSPITTLYLRAAYLHLRLSAFFSPPDLPSYRTDLLGVYHATTEFLESCLNLENQVTVTTVSNYSHGLPLIYSTNYVFQMMLAAGFALLKLNHTFLKEHNLDTQGASELFTRTTWALRSMSVQENDLAERLAEVLAQVWRSGRVRAQPEENNIGEPLQDDSLQLKVRCRMSMSHVYDSVWRWRQNFQFKNGKPLESYLKNPTDPAAATDSGVSSRELSTNPNIINGTDTTVTTSNTFLPALAPPAAEVMDGFGMDYADPSNYEVFDPLNWMLDGLVELPYSYSSMHHLEAQGLGAASMSNGI